MSSTLRIKRRAATGAAGAPSALKNGELAYSEKDNILYYGFGDDGLGNATSIIGIGGNGSVVDLSTAQTVGGVKTFSSSPVAPTPTAGDNSTKVATTAFVTTAVGGAGGTQAINTVYAGPASGGSGAPSFRALVANDIPSIPSSKISDKGSANGVASLDSGGKVPVGQLPSSVTSGLNFVATIAASGSLPASPIAGQYWIISSAGTFTGTSHALKVGDWIIYDGNAGGDLATGWDYIDNSVQVSSVFGRAGAVTAQSGDYTSDQVTEGTTNLYFTAARVLATVIAGLSTATNAVITSADSILVAMGKLQAQVTARLIASNNLSDIVSASTARTNLGLGSAALLASSAVAQTANNLSDLASPSTARTNLGLGTAATLASTAVAQTANNLSDLASASTARTNLGLGTMATQNANAVAITGGTIDNVTFDGGTY